MSTEFINLSEIYLPTAGGSIDGDVEIGGALTVNDGTGAGTTYDLAYEISQLRAENEELKAAWDSVSQASDYIVSEGTSGDWYYRKWASGWAECYGIAGQYISSVNTSTTTYFDYPFAFTERPIVDVTTYDAAGWLHNFTPFNNSSSTTSAGIQASLKDNSYMPITMMYKIIAKGWWK